jgi:hypothetical protein
MAHAILEYVVAGHHVTCIQEASGHQVWRCQCPDFKRRAATGEGYCPHTALAIQQAITEGKIAITSI